MMIDNGKFFLTTLLELPLDSRLMLLFTGVTAIVSLASVFLIVFALETLNETKKTNQGDFILQLNRDFFFNERFLRMRQAIEKKKVLLQANKGKFTEQDIDDYIGFFDTIEGLLTRKILDRTLVDKNFSYYIKDLFSSQEIRTYIDEVRKECKDHEIYKGFERLGKLYTNQKCTWFDIIEDMLIVGLLKAMEDMYEDEEATFEWTKLFYYLQQTCPIHHIGRKNLALQRYSCPICNKMVEKTPLIN